VGKNPSEWPSLRRKLIDFRNVEVKKIGKILPFVVEFRGAVITLPSEGKGVQLVG